MDEEKVFCGFLRLLISSLERAANENDPQKQRRALKEIITDLQNTLEE